MRRCALHALRLRSLSPVRTPAVREALDTADRAWSLVETARQVGRQEFVPSFLAHAKVCTARLEAAIAFACAHPGANGPCYSGSAAWKVFLAVSAPHTPLPPCVGNWTTERAIAEGFADLFAAKSAGTDALPRRPAAEPPPQVTSAEVQMAIAAFSRGKAGDPDGLDAELLQLLPSDAHLWLAKVFDMCLRTGLPARWKRECRGTGAETRETNRPAVLLPPCGADLSPVPHARADRPWSCSGWTMAFSDDAVWLPPWLFNGGRDCFPGDVACGRFERADTIPRCWRRHDRRVLSCSPLIFCS
ncbi:reverse transcriptase, putative [Bodo saltans]|uniref:Reverse transcriptase, putative n=1 Tax=Bodo saltans TaxID=75058 RepID=A0A0S4IPI3_BODSA|nr:reverse transcriptase, putative [Bodo saltans]|eukprot:CUF85811.1 reverse transcriptase, putative [Bodo saltans]